MIISPLSSNQKSIWNTQKIFPNSPVYNIGGYALINESIDIDIFNAALSSLVKTNEALAICIDDNTLPYSQYINTENRSTQVYYIDYSSKLDLAFQLCRQWMEDDMSRTFDSGGPLFKTVLFKMDDERYCWYLKMHHVISDGYSFALVFNKLSALYKLLLDKTDTGEITGDNKKPAFFDFVSEEIAYKNSLAYEKDRAYWVKMFQNAPFNQTGAKINGLSSGRKEMIIERGMFGKLSSLCKEYNIQPFHFFVATLQLLYARMRDKENLVIGVPVLNRSNSSSKNTVGPFFNVLPITFDCRSIKDFSEVIGLVKTKMLESYRHQKFPVNDLLELLDRKGNVYEITFSNQKIEYHEFKNSRAEINFLHSTEMYSDLAVHLLEYDEEQDVRLLFDYRLEIISEYEIVKLIETINQIVRNAGQFIKGNVTLIGDLFDREIILHRQYWKNKLLKEIPKTIVSRDLMVTSTLEYKGDSLTVAVKKQLTADLSEFNASHNSTVLATVLTCLKILLYKYTGEKDTIVGIPEVNPIAFPFHGQQGYYLTIVPLRHEVDIEDSFLNNLKSVKQSILETDKHKVYPVDMMLRDLHMQANSDTDALFDLLLIIEKENNKKAPFSIGSGSVVSKELKNKKHLSKNNIIISLRETKKSLEFRIEYNSNFFFREKIQRLGEHLQHILKQVVENESLRIRDIQIVSSKEKQELLHYSSPEDSFRIDTTVMDEFYKHVSRTPDRIAVVFERNRLSYKKLDDLSESISNYLRKRLYVETEDRVAMILNRSEQLAVVSLGILKAGCAYVAIDNSLPEERKKYILENSSCKAVITESQYVSDIGKYWDGEIIAHDEIPPDADTLPKIKSKPDHCAFIIYTSGSTGTPKGIEQTHKCLFNVVMRQVAYGGFEPDLNVLQYSSVSFDVFIAHELFFSLLSGGCIYIIREDERKDLVALGSFILRNEIEWLLLPVSALNTIVEVSDDLWSKDIKIKHIVSAGEQLNLSKKLISYLEMHPTIRLHNFYGPSETHNASNYTLLRTHDIGAEQPIGRPSVNTWIHILSEDHQLAPIGIPGELYISGASLAKGYIHLPELTSERFIPNPYLKSKLMYKTGDIGKWLPDGNIKFLGRKDDQVKIRGYRVELGEIENALLKHPKVKQCAVIAPMENFSRDLYAYIVGEETIQPSELRTFLHKSLPDYMVPGFYIHMDKLPLNSNGKIDKRNLPVERQELIATDDHAEPRNQVDEKLLVIWKELLKRDRISIDADFFEIGGHSLKAMQLLSRIIKELNCRLELSLIFKSPTIRAISELIQKGDRTEFNAIANVTLKNYYELTPAQKQLWLLCQLKGAQIAYNIPAAFILEGKIDKPMFREALRELVNRHEILRTIFITVNGEPKQRFLTAEEIDFHLEEIQLDPAKKEAEHFRVELEQWAILPFNLSKAPLLKARLIQLNDGKHLFLFVIHHLISDGWSMHILINELTTLYSGLRKGKGNPLKPLKIQYKDYVYWNNTQLSGEKFEQHYAYWSEKLSGELSPLDLPFNRRRPAVKTYNGKAWQFHLNKEITNNLQKITTNAGASTFMVLLASIKLLLYKYTGQEDIILGTPISGRNHSDLEDQVGFYVNILPLRTRFSEMESFNLLLDKIRLTVLEAYEHQEYPFDLLVSKLSLNNDLSKSPFFDVGFTWHESGYSDIPVTVDFTAKQFPFEFKTSKYDLWLHGHDKDGQIWFSLEYNTDLFDEATIIRFAEHYKNLLLSALRDPDKAIHQLDYLTEREKDKLIREFNNVTTVYPKDKAIQQLFEEQAAAVPEAIAVVYENRKLTYKTLNEKANQLAHYLRANHAIRPDDRIGIMMERSEQMVISILGVLKSGAAYVPIDLSSPPERIAYMLSDSGVKLLITSSASMFVLVDYYSGPMFVMDIQAEELKNYPASDLICINSPEDLIYIMYTSGSTGNPKGVMVEHRSVARLVLNTNYIAISNNDRLLQTGSVAFDAIIFELWGLLLNGGSVYFMNHLSLLEPSTLIREVREKKITILWMTTAWFHELCNSSLELFSELTWLIFGGEVLSVKHLNLVRRAHPALRIIHAYGPTENTTYSTCHRVDKEYTDNVPIGRPIANSSVYILDTHLNPVPIGVAGEMYVGGDGLARGYLNQKELTSEKFIVNPFRPGERIYRSGDQGRWLEDGTIEFIGRKDNQIKINGYRIELGEIENALRALPGIEDAAVIIKVNDQHAKRLVAFVVATEALDRMNLRLDLEKSLPRYMIPSDFVQLEMLPLTLNAKVDRKQLVEIEYAGWSENDNYTAPRNDLEMKVAEIWSGILNRNRIGIRDDFFEIGGDSIKVLRMVSELNKELNLKIQIADVYRNNTIEHLLHYVLQNQKVLLKKDEKINDARALVENELNALKERILSSINDLDKENISDLYPMSDIEKGMIFSSSLLGQGVYHDQLAYQRVFKNFNPELFTKAVGLLIEKHTILRTSFNVSEFETEIQIVHNKIAFVIPYEDISDLNELKQKEYVKTYMKSELNHPFEMSSAPLWKLSLFNCGSDRIIVLWQFHHAILDGWSNACFVTELNNLYLQLVKDPFSTVENLKSSYRDYIIKCELDKKDTDLKDFWKTELKGYSRLDLFTDEEEFKSYTTSLDRNQFKLLEKCAFETNTTVKIVSLSAYLYMLSVLNYGQEVVSGLVTNTRPECEDSDKILGCFLNTIPLRMMIDGNIRCKDFIELVNKKLIDLKDKEQLTLPVISQIHNENSANGNPFFDIMFNYIDFNVSNEAIVDALAEDHEMIDEKSSFLEYVRTNTYLDFTVNLTDGSYITNLILTRKLKSGLPPEKIVEIYFQILRHFAGNSDQPMNQVSFLDTEESAKLLMYSGPEAVFNIETTVVDDFEIQAKKNGDKIAIVYENVELTYRQLDDQSNRIAHYLRTKLNVQVEDLIGLMLERSEKLAVITLGILKAGCAYVAIDHSYPEERKLYILNDSNCKILITDVMYEEALSVKWKGRIIHPEFLSSKNELTKLPKLKLSPDNGAFVIYTSGSTGEPKGILQTHKCLSNVVRRQTDYGGFEKGLKVLQYSSVGFDVFIAHELFFALLSEGSLYIINDDERKDLIRLGKYIALHKIEWLLLPVSALNLIVDLSDHLWSKDIHIRHLVSAGEQLNLSKKLIAYLETYPAIKLHNFYGPSETHNASNYTVNSSNEILRVQPIGRPTTNAWIYILSEGHQLLPPGIPGELYIAGAGLAREYVNQPALTNQKFISNPFQKGERMYKTGDIGKWLPDGNIQFLGRKDDQIKIRGYRVELGEIENTLLKLAEIKQCAVVARGEQGNKELVAFINGEGDLTISEIRAYLLNRLPDYMVPMHFIQLEHIPLNANGKIDKKNLPSPENLGLKVNVEYVAPRNETEITLVSIWQEILQRDHIGIQDNFFELGGHSLKATRVLSRIYKNFETQISIRDIFRYPTIVELAGLIQQSGVSSFIPIPLLQKSRCYELSHAQRRMWIAEQLGNGQNGAFNIPCALLFEPSLGIDLNDLPVNILFGHKEPSEQDETWAKSSKLTKNRNYKENPELIMFQKSFEALVQKHEILRTIFKEDETGEIKQWITDQKDFVFKVQFKDFRGKENIKGSVQSYLKEDSCRPFDLQKGPLLRAALLQISDGKYILYFNMHHIISDGWSMNVLIKELFSSYKALKEKTKFEPEEQKKPKAQYKDYAAWQSAQLENNAFHMHNVYWKENLSGELPLLCLPDMKQRPRIKSGKGYMLGTYVDEITVNMLKKYLETNGGSLFMGMLAAWNILIYRYTSQTDIIIGTPVAGRDHPDLEDQIGFYVNTLALRNEIRPEENFNTFYKRLKDRTLESYNHQQYPFDRLVEELNFQRDTSRSAVFDIMLTFQNTNGKTKDIKAATAEKIEDLGNCASKFDIELFIQEFDNSLSIHIIYNPDIYEREMMENMMRHFRQLLKELLLNPEEKIAAIDYLSKKEKHRLLLAFNDTIRDYPRNKTIVDLFEEQAAKTPDNIAIQYEKKKLTYRELDEQSNQLASYLQKNYKLGPDKLVAIKMDRSEKMLIAIMGILKSGGAYVPIDPEFPKERATQILEDSKPGVLLDQNEWDAFERVRSSFKKTNCTTSCRSNNLIYVIYTSGSTGQPKGVLIEHGGVVNRLLWMQRDLKVDGRDVFLQKTPVTFDVSVWELFLPLISGSRLVIAKPEGHKDPVYLESIIRDSNISIIHFVPSMLSAMLDHIKWNKLSGLKHIVCSGEALSKELEITFRKKSQDTQLHNYYGPTEASVDVTSINLTRFPTSEKEVSIGRPIDNTGIYIVNQMDRLQPVGVIGEILIGGDQVARGYLNKPALSKEKFTPNPFKEKDRVYRTGDLGRWVNNGTIEFIGRKDNQVKIRGYRIELNEIEHALLTHEQIKKAVVVVKENENKEKVLVAYITAKTKQNLGGLRSHLENVLPPYMLPAHYVQLEIFPLTANGKIDKKALPEPENSGLSNEVNYIAPRNKLEEELVKIWEKLLQRKHIGVNDDFFVLGGHSLSALRLCNEYQKGLSAKLSLKDVFVHTSIASQAELIRSSAKSEFIQIEKVTTKKNYAISDAQRRLWILSQFEGGSVAYNIPGSICLTEAIDIDCFKRAIESVIERHEILRTVFKRNKNQEVRQWILKKEELDLTIGYKDFRKYSDREEKAESYITEDSYEPFDFENGPLFRIVLLHLEDNRYVFYYNMHHIISDGWSMDVLAKDVFSYYESYKKGKEPALNPLRIQYKDYSAWQLAQLKDISFEDHRAYWLSYLNGELPLLNLPSSKQRPRIKTTNGYGIKTSINPAATGKLKAYSQANGGSLFMSLLAVWNVLMYHYTSQNDLIIGTPVSGREHADLEDQIGFYVNTIALRTRINPEEDFNTFYASLKDNMLTGYNHQLYPFDRLVDELNVQKDTSRNPVFDIMFIFQDNEKKSAGSKSDQRDWDQLTDLGYRKAKFDMEVVIQETGDSLTVNLIYNTDVYEGRMVKGLIHHYKQLLNEVLENPGEPIAQIDYLLPDEKLDLHKTFNETGFLYADTKTVIDLIDAQALKTPDHVAVVCRENRLTYRQLNEKANQLAHYILSLKHPGKGDFICICMERSENLIITLLGILRSGFAYILLDPLLPEERLKFILEDSKSKLLVNNEFIHNAQKALPFFSKEKPAVALKPDDIVYLMYTSGSTGVPKGAVNTYRGFTNTVRWYVEEIGISDIDKVGIISNVSFDLTQKNFFAPLTVGASLYINSEFHPAHAGKFIGQNEISIINCAPTMFYSLWDESKNQLNSLRKIILGGESINFSLIKECFEKQDVKLFNSYGPSEASDVSVYHLIKKDQTGNVPIGRPIRNTTAFVLNEKLKQVPIGVAGEICIGGIGVGLGYLNEPELTDQKFIDTDEWGRLYRTGDMGRFTYDGVIEFIGRVDNQVKIRGQRIELEEIEACIQQFNDIVKQVCVDVKAMNGEQELVAYVVPSSTFDKQAFRRMLIKKLPGYMIPAYFIELDALPMNSNGKADRKSLPEPQDLVLPDRAEYQSPRNTLEERIVEMLEVVLKRAKAQISIYDNFFDLGLNSLKLIQLLSLINEEFGSSLNVVLLFEYSTVESLAAYVSNESRNSNGYAQVLDNNDTASAIDEMIDLM